MKQQATMAPHHTHQRSDDAKAYRRWYKTARWARIRDAQLAKEPLCRICKAAGRIVTATVCDHITPHRGDPAIFWTGPFQSLCDEAPWRCHSSAKQREDVQGFSRAVGPDGFPLDPRHPFNKNR